MEISEKLLFASNICHRCEFGIRVVKAKSLEAMLVLVIITSAQFAREWSVDPCGLVEYEDGIPVNAHRLQY